MLRSSTRGATAGPPPAPPAGAPRRVTGAVALLLAACVVAADDAPPRPADEPHFGPVRDLPASSIEAVEVLLSAVMSTRGLPAISVAIGQADRVVYADGYGLADVENFVPARADSVYRIASISKVITAVALLQLVERAELDLDGPVREHCQAFPEKRWPVTARQLLGHRGGVRTYRDGEQPMTRRFETLEEGLRLFADDPLEYEPGTRFLYSTYGYSVLGCVIEGVTGRSYADVVREAVFDPARMTRTAPEDLRTLVAGRVRGYVRNEKGRLRNAALADMSYKVPGGGISSTAPDIARFGLALLGGRLVQTATLEGLLRARDAVPGQAETWGLALPVGTRDDRPEAWHLGGQEGTSTALYLRPDDGTVVALLTNLEGSQPALLDLARRLADVVSPKAAASENSSARPPWSPEAGVWPNRRTASID